MTVRVNQRERTRMAIVAAAREVVGSAGEITMPEVARRALVSEATAYRYFPDLASLLRETMAGVFASPAEVLAPVAGSADPVRRVGFAAEALLREVLAGWEGPLPRLVYVTDAGYHQTTYFEEVL